MKNIEINKHSISKNEDSYSITNRILIILTLKRSNITAVDLGIAINQWIFMINKCSSNNCTFAFLSLHALDNQNP